MPSKPVWSEGLLVSQHHFQQQDRYHELRLEERLAALHRYGWGITVLEIDDRSLVSGQFRLQRLSAIWPDGTSLECGEGTDLAAPEPRSFESAFPPGAQKLEVFLAFAEETEATANLNEDAEGGLRRYRKLTRAVPDLNTGGSQQELDFADPNLRIVFGGERHEGFSVVRIAEIVRQQNGQPIIRDNYVPPVLHVGAAPFLEGGLRRVLSALSARQRQLCAERKQNQTGAIDFHVSDARTFWLLHALNGCIPQLAHLLDTRRAHPEEAYLLLATLIGQLTTFSTDADPAAIPKFNYLDLGDTFEPMFARVLSLLSVGIERQYAEIPLEQRPDGMCLGKILETRYLKQELFVAVKGPIPEAILRDRVPALLKVAAWNQIYEIVKQTRYGVRVEVEWKPSGALPIKPGVCFFRITKQGSYWDEIAKTSTIALYLPTDADWTGTELALYALDARYLQ